MNESQCKLYRALVESPPSNMRDAIGAAYWKGYHNPVMPVGDAYGEPGRLARAAFKAGQSNSREIR